MEILLLLLLVILWYGCGVASFIYWWVKDFDLMHEDLLMCCFIGGPIGPLMHPLGWFTHRYNKMAKDHSKVYIKRRTV